jgi:hypothetical protein
MSTATRTIFLLAAALALAAGCRETPETAPAGAPTAPPGGAAPQATIVPRPPPAAAPAARAAGPRSPAAPAAEGTPPAPPVPQASAAPALSFADVPVADLRAAPDRHVGEVFEERFTFLQVWWGRERRRPGKQFLDLPTHFTARVKAAPLSIARIEFPPAADTLFETLPSGTDVLLRVRFVGLHEPGKSPIFRFERLLPARRARSALDELRR